MTNPAWPHSIREINDLPQSEKAAIYQTLLPDWVFPTFRIDPETYSVSGVRVIHFRCPSGSSTVELSVFHTPDAIDPALFLHMGDTFNSQLIVLMAVVNDPESPRYDVDVDERGTPTQLGTSARNIPEELRAMEAGLAPGQIRRGLRIFRTAIPLFDQFVRRMGHDLYFIEPLFYHNAVTFERYGFAYSRGIQKMKQIHQEFLPGGALHTHLNDSTPFRHSQAWKTVRGRSWAIHDGILGEPLTGIQMYKAIGKNNHTTTFPNAEW
jgi:hypothetical protein